MASSRTRLSKPSATDASPETFRRFGVRPLINASGIYTDLGGTVFSPGVWAAMEQINSSFVRMVDLLDRSGEMLARLVGAEAARVTPGASAAITLGTAACIAGKDGKAWEQLPDTTGLKSEVIIQRGHRYKYDRMARIPGARLVETGGDAASIAAAISPRTAMVMFPAHLDGAPGTLGLREVSAITRGRGVPLLVDAAYLNYPTSLMHSFLEAGADLVCFSAKYYWGPNSGGFICGRRDLIEAVAGIDFTRYESGKFLTFGRPFKLDRHTIVATVVALEEWLAMDHDARFASYRERVDAMRNQLNELSGVSTSAHYFAMDETLQASPITCMALTFSAGSQRSAERICEALLAGEPSIATVVVDGKLVVAVDTLLDDQHIIIGKRLRELLAAGD